VLSDQVDDHQVRAANAAIACYSSSSSSIRRRARRRALRVRPGTAQRQRGLELGSDGIRYHLQRFRCVSLHSATLRCARCAID
jgi:hypothetical protein